MTSAWTAEHVRLIETACSDRLPVITQIDRSNLANGIVYWDMWPIQQADGHTAKIAGRELWMALTAPDRGDPSLRHFEAKIRLLERRENTWQDLGALLPDFPVPYEREWAGSAMFGGECVTLFFTGAGVAEKAGGYQQRLFETRATLGKDGLPSNWTVPSSLVDRVSKDYIAADAHAGEAGKIKAFRDPAYFRDPADGGEYLIFTASLAMSLSEYNGAIGIARRYNAGWQLLPPIIHADAVNNELERAHVVYHRGLYYAFWVTQSGTFSPDLRHAPNGLYGMVSESLFGEYRPLNGTGLVFANPQSQPYQCYSWFVDADLLVSSFVDFYMLDDGKVPEDAAKANRHFGGVPAPLLRLAMDGERCRLTEEIYA